MTEQDYEKLLNIKTAGEQKLFNKSVHYNRYEPTSYTGLELLCEHYQFTPADHIVDFGCGKGRLAFYLHHFFAATVTGIEMDPFFCQEALANRAAYAKKYPKKADNIHFLQCLGEQYAVAPTANIFYFFNPFSEQIFMKVMGNILTSLEQQARPADVILYYPSPEYIYFLEHLSPFTQVAEIKIPHAAKHDPRCTFLVYRLDPR